MKDSRMKQIIPGINPPINQIGGPIINAFITGSIFADPYQLFIRIHRSLDRTISGHAELDSAGLPTGTPMEVYDRFDVDSIRDVVSRMQILTRRASHQIRFLGYHQ